MSHPSLQLTARDFDAYAPEKATSNVYARPRMDVKQRGLAWGRGVAAELADAGILLEVSGSDEVPTLRNKKRVDCQWVYLARDKHARDELERLLDQGRSIAKAIAEADPWKRHALLFLRLDAATVEVGLALHPEARVDIDNVRARLGATESAGPIAAAVNALPQEFEIVLGEVGASAPLAKLAVGDATVDALVAFTARLADGEAPLRVSWSLSRDAALAPSSEDGPSLDEQLERALVALAPLYRLLAWSPSNDQVVLARRIEDAEHERERAHVEAQARTAEWQARRWTPPPVPLVSSVSSVSRAPRHAGALVPEAPRAAPDPALVPRSAPPGPRAAPDPALVPRASSQGQPANMLDSRAAPESVSASLKDSVDKPVRAAAPAAAPVLERGVKVLVRSGPFTDKTGIIGELDGRGGARVLFGLLSTRVELADLEPVTAPGQRPALASSHRRIAPAPRRAR